MTSISPQAFGLEVPDNFAPPDAREQPAEFVLMALRQEYAAGLSENLPRCEPEDAIGGGIPCSDGPIESPGKDGIVGLFHNRRQLIGFLGPGCVLRRPVPGGFQPVRSEAAGGCGAALWR